MSQGLFSLSATPCLGPTRPAIVWHGNSVGDLNLRCGGHVTAAPWQTPGTKNTLQSFFVNFPPPS